MRNGFITKIDYSDNRQIKQRVLTDTRLSGATTFGTSFSDLPSGPNPNDSGTTQVIGGVISGSFSGDSGTTIFIFDDNRLNVGVKNLNVITPSNSATTQETGNAFEGSSILDVDGNVVNLAYSGANYLFDVTGMTETIPGIYTGLTQSSLVTLLSAGTLDYTGRTIWVNILGILSAKTIESDVVSATTFYGDGSNLTGIPTTSYTEKTANYTATTSNNTINCVGNSFTITLPTAVGNVGKIFNIKNSAAGTTITVDPYGSETIDGEVTQTVTNPDNLQIQSTGSNWIIL
jgi:hypothetical protein